MKLPFFQKKTDTELREYLFALEIGHESIKSAIWSVVNNKTQVLSIGEPVSWDETKEDQLVIASDKSLSDAITKFDHTGNTQPKKIILGLPPDWVSEDKIAPDRLKSLKELTNKLSLTAIGFVVTPQALVRHLHHVEGVPPTAILVGFGQLHLEVALVRLGKIEAVHLVRRSASVPEDLIEGLYRFGRIDMLPSRILIYDSTQNLEEIRQQLLAYPWQAPQTKLPFLHFPKVENLPSDFSIKAISLSGGSEVAEAIGLIPHKQELAPQTPTSPTSQADLAPEELGFSTQAPETEAPKVTKKLPPLPKLPKFNFPKLRLIPIALVLVFVILFASAGFYLYFSKASINLLVKTQTLDMQFELPIVTEGIEASLTSEQEKSTTGTKLIGDKATGEVSIINGTSTPKQFPAGTVITSPSGLKFTFDSAVTVASASGTADPNSYQPGKANVKVTASNIGSDSNLSAGTQFQVGSYSSLDFISRNESAFSGGSSRQVAAVSKDDLSTLKSQTLESLTSQAKEKLLSQLNQDQKIIDSTINISVTKESYSQKLDDTSDKLKLSLTVKATGLFYNQTDLNDQILSELSPKVPPGYKLDPNPEVSLNLVVSKDKSTKVSISTKALLVPVLDLDAITKSVTGKPISSTKDYLNDLPNLKSYEIFTTPSLPSFISILPIRSENISIAVKTLP